MVDNTRDRTSRTSQAESGGAQRRPPGKSAAPAIVGAVVLAGAVIGLGAVYGTKGVSGNRESASCPGSAAIAAKLDPLIEGEMASLTVSPAPRPLTPVSFKGPDGSALSLADFKGKTVLLNLWATWCIPCRKEMPALNRLQAELGGKDFEVVAVNIDTRRLDRVGAFLDDNRIDRLARYTDASAGILQSLRGEGLAQGLPTSVLIDKRGCRLAAMAGPAEWASEDARKLIRAAMEQ